MKKIKKSKKKLPDTDELRRNNEEINSLKKNLELEKGDLPALIIAAFTTIFPAVLITVGIIVGIIWLLFP